MLLLMLELSPHLWLCFIVSVLSNPESQNKHHSFHPAYLSGIMWSSKKENRWKLFGGGREGNVVLQDPYYFSFPLCPSLHFLPTPCVPLMSSSGQRAPPFQTVTPQPWFLDSTVYCFPPGMPVLTSQEQPKDGSGSWDLLRRSGGPPHILRP